MQLSIKSNILEKTLTFSRPVGSNYIFVNSNGLEGTLGRQICKGGHEDMGSAISYSGESVAAFDKLCRAWYRAFVTRHQY